MKILADMLVSVALSVRLFPPNTSQFSSNFYQTLHAGGTGLRKNGLDFQGHWVKDQGHAATIVEIS